MPARAQVLGQELVAAGVTQVFGVIGSGNFHLTNAMIGAGARFVAARHEGGAATMADAYARTSDEVAAVSVHQGCGYTNALTGIAEAAKSRTPLIVLAPMATSATSNFAIDQAAIAQAVGASVVTVTADAAISQVRSAVEHARQDRRTVVLNLPLDVLEQQADTAAPPRQPPVLAPQEPSQADVTRMVDALAHAERPVFIVGRGGRSRQAKAAVADLAERAGALLATSAVASGLFQSHDWDLGIAGGFSSPTAAELISNADVIIAWACGLNMWTMRHGRLIHPEAVVMQVDDTATALGAHREVDLGVHADVTMTARAVAARSSRREGYRTPAVARDLAGATWRELPYEDRSSGAAIDPRTLTRELDTRLPLDRVVSVDSGNFMGYPSAMMRVPDERGFCFTQAFQSIGLGLATAIGAALAQPDRLPVAALGDGGALMAAAELETVRRLGLGMVIVVYNDAAYSAEVHHFAGEDHSTVTFPETDIAAIARGYGLAGITVRARADLGEVDRWLDGPREHALVIDAKVTSEPAWWLAEAFGH